MYGHGADGSQVEHVVIVATRRTWGRHQGYKPRIPRGGPPLLRRSGSGRAGDIGVVVGATGEGVTVEDAAAVEVAGETVADEAVTTEGVGWTVSGAGAEPGRPGGGTALDRAPPAEVSGRSALVAGP